MDLNHVKVDTDQRRERTERSEARRLLRLQLAWYRRPRTRSRRIPPFGSSVLQRRRYLLSAPPTRSERRRNRENANVFSRSDHAAGERCRASAAVLCRSVGFTLDVDYSPNDAFRVVLLTPPGSSCSIQIGNGLTDAPVGSVRNVYLVITTSRPRGAACSTVGSKSVRSGTRRLLEPGTEVSRSGLTPRAETMLASPTSPIRMATAGCYRNGATAMS